MIVRDDGTAWQVVMQSDHAAVAGAIARAWGGGEGFAVPPLVDSVVRACAHHDDGWLSWERQAVRDADGAPKTFFKVPSSRQMDFYRGTIATLDDVDPYAALLTSLHACGLYGEETGWKMTPIAAAYQADAERFVAEYSGQRAARIAAIGIDERAAWTAFEILQVADRISLHFCMRPDDGAQTIQRIFFADGRETPLELTAVAPGVLVLDPFPFAGDALALTLARRLVPKQELASDDALRAVLAATPVEQRPLRLERAA